MNNAQAYAPTAETPTFLGKEPVSVIIPAYNEEVGVGTQIDDIRQALVSAEIPHEIIVIDDGSDDETVERALEAGARVLQHAKNRGYGASLKTGIMAAEHEIITIIDADGTYPSDQIPKLVTELETADMAVGARTGDEVHIPLVRRPAKWILRRLANHIAGQTIPDLNSGLRVFRRSCVQQYFSVLSDQFSFTTTVTLAYMADNYRVVYSPINYYKRIGKSKIIPRHFMDFVILVFRMAMLFQPLRVFIPLALLFGSLGFGKIVFDIIAAFQRTGILSWSILIEPVLSTSAILMLIVGLQLLLIGMVADGVLRKIAQHGRTLIASHAVFRYERTDGASG